jgi:peptidoglycan/xylan/chitin deacetylase (PgdA/CDA1 family)
MLSLYTRDDYAALGLEMLLDIERIPFRRIRDLAEHDQPLLIALGSDLSARESAQIAARPSLVLNGGAAFAAEVLAVDVARLSDESSALALTPPLWPAERCALAQQFGKAVLRVPRAPICRLPGRTCGDTIATLRAGAEAVARPAVVQIGPCVWSAIDLGSAFAHLLTERYAPGAQRESAVRARMRRVAETIYYAAPPRLRDALQVASYRVLERRVEALGARASEYPIDATGWLLIELVKTLIGRAAGSLLRIAHWPAGYRSAALLTHDLEPQQYAYSDGLDRLLQRVSDLKLPSAFGVVATPGDRYLRGAQRGALAAHDVFSHGLDHRGEQVWGRDGVVSSVRAARATVERVLERSVYGYRSPRLDRSPDLDWALDHAGFTYDSSHPDIDRENIQHYGRGVRLNMPYRPLLEDGDGQWRFSRCLELPLTAPDCIQPLFAGQDAAQLRATIEEKAAFIRGSGGLYVALVHAGVFGPDDAARREAHLDVVVEQLRHADTWLTNPQRLVDWWCGREQLCISSAESTVRVHNRGPRPVDGAVAVVERDGSTHAIALPSLAAGADVTVRVDAVSHIPSNEWSACNQALQ